MATRAAETGNSAHADLTPGERIMIARKRRGLNQDELGKLVGANERTVQRWEKDDFLPRGEQLRRLAEELALSADYLLGLRPTPS